MTLLLTYHDYILKQLTNNSNIFLLCRQINGEAVCGRAGTCIWKAGDQSEGKLRPPQKQSRR